MPHPTTLHAGLFVGSILGLAAVAGTRAAPFHVPVDAELLDGTAARAVEAQYEASFPVKTLGVNVWAAIDYLLFGEGRPGVVIGQDGWLYTDEEFRTYPDAGAQIARHLALIADVRELLAARNIQLVVAALPSKTRIYPEHLHRELPSDIHQPLYAALRGAAADAGAVTPDLERALLECKKLTPVFLRTDTHWTPAGARCAAHRIAAAVAEAGIPVADGGDYRIARQPAVAHAGDLLNFLPLAPYLADLLPPADTLVAERTESVGAVDLFDETPPPRISLVGTSYSADSRWNFAGALTAALHEDVVSYAAEGQGPFAPMLEYLRGPEIRHAPPRMVIWEIPERYLLAPDRRAGSGAAAPPLHDNHPVRDPAPRLPQEIST